MSLYGSRNLAADLVVNQLVHPLPLPAGAISLGTFPQLQLQPNRSVEHYYRRLESISDDSALAELAGANPSDHGRWAACGGTDFTPALRWLREQGGGRRFDGCIYLTDGCAAAPEVRPPCRLLWVLTPSGQGGEHLRWGKQIRMEGG